MRVFIGILLISLAFADMQCNIENPVVCGFSGLWHVRSDSQIDISEQMCHDRGCCYKEDADVKCFYPNVGMGNITKVHVIHGCHFDAGFVDTTLNIVNRYFDEIYPRVYKVSFCIGVLMTIGGRGVHEGWRCCSDEVHYAVLASFPVLRLSPWSGNPLPHSGMRLLDLGTCDC